MPRIRFHPLADGELASAIAWYKTRSETAAAEFVAEIEHAILRIADSPERYVRTAGGRHRFVLINFPFDVVYRVRRDGIEIVAISHHARRPGYWRSR